MPIVLTNYVCRSNCSNSTLESSVAGLIALPNDWPKLLGLVAAVVSLR